MKILKLRALKFNWNQSELFYYTLYVIYTILEGKIKTFLKDYFVNISYSILINYVTFLLNHDMHD